MILALMRARAILDPFFEETTVNIRCDVIEPTTMQGYERDPRSLAKRAEAYLKSTGIADYALFGPENEFFIFDSVTYNNDMNGAGYRNRFRAGRLEFLEGIRAGQHGPPPGHQGRLLPGSPVDAFQDIRSAMCLALEEMGLKVEVHHHEVATGGQARSASGAGTLVKKADEVQILKYAILNVAHGYGKTATFMPKPLVGDNGSGMHVHQSLQKEGKALFAGDKYGGLSDAALYYIGGIIKHAKALNAFTNPATNSYKRLVPGFEAPVMLAYSARNRSASIRIPVRVEPEGAPHRSALPRLLRESVLRVRGHDDGRPGWYPDKIHPGDPADKDLYDLEPEEAKHIPTVCHSPRHGAGASRQGSRVPDTRRCFHQRCHRRLHGAEMQEITRFRMSTPPGGARDVLQPLMDTA